jgi:hypothetical protein
MSVPVIQLECGTSGNSVPTILLECGTSGDTVPTILLKCNFMGTAYAHMRIGLNSDWEQGIVIRSTQLPVPGSALNAEFMPNTTGDNGPASPSQTFTLVFDPVANTMTFRMSNATANSVYTMPAGYYENSEESYDLKLEVYAAAREGYAELSNLSLLVTGETPVALDDMRVDFPDTISPVTVSALLGKGFTLSGTITMSWVLTRPRRSEYQAMVRF